MKCMARIHYGLVMPVRLLSIRFNSRTTLQIWMKFDVVAVLFRTASIYCFEYPKSSDNNITEDKIREVYTKNLRSGSQNGNYRTRLI
ncbi:hypothetical protein L798_08510 [Zootermopsis nevadensis]|uniref:Uncharacterized protein n=1 Tax=Zootermopsis nevadensis TaxID=136037 RepID=A0A067R2T4_ZOONE|nr:hypothetical protein L798_08510 [Zootermopsis nevadensis]